ncbi:MAG: hypothetical protein NTZ24_16095 [Deltaproteobacteria bacterium]|nr:hypothetical protein [Deltaproteobacteria bacterium]
MSRNRFTAEQIIGLLREADVKLIEVSSLGTGGMAAMKIKDGLTLTLNVVHFSGGKSAVLWQK